MVPGDTIKRCVEMATKSQSPLIGALVPGKYGVKGTLRVHKSQSPLIGALVPGDRKGEYITLRKKSQSPLIGALVPGDPSLIPQEGPDRLNPL